MNKCNECKSMLSDYYLYCPICGTETWTSIKRRARELTQSGVPLFYDEERDAYYNQAGERFNRPASGEVVND